MTIKAEGKYTQQLMHMTDAGPTPISTDELFAGKTVALFACRATFPDLRQPAFAGLY